MNYKDEYFRLISRGSIKRAYVRNDVDDESYHSYRYKGTIIDLIERREDWGGFTFDDVVNNTKDNVILDRHIDIKKTVLLYIGRNKTGW